MKMKKSKRNFILLLVLFAVLFLKKTEILNFFGNFLIVENSFLQIDNAFVLSGGAFDRGNKAAELINSNKITKIICTGANQPPDFKALKIDMLESELTRKNIISQIADSSKVYLIKRGTSTLEESEIILDYCKINGIDSCVIISSKFHTRRIKQVFVKKFARENITVFISGAPSSSYDEKNWWKSENGLIALNNEYIKQLYYLFK